MAKAAVKWLHKSFAVSVMTMSPAHKDYGHHNLPVERIGNNAFYFPGEPAESDAPRGRQFVYPFVPGRKRLSCGMQKNQRRC